MDHQIISLADADFKENKVVEPFERHLRKSLNDIAGTVGLFLRPEQQATSELLDWLEAWTREFRQTGKQLVVIPATADQFEALELSHPDQYLCYYSSLEQWEEAFPVEPVKKTATISGPEIAAPKAPEAPPASASVPGVEPAPSFSYEPSVSLLPVAVGATVEISGEYACLGCGRQRTWLKGDIMEPCDNVECLDTDKGWKISCDLF
jgi:hypothetical protein